MDLSPETLRAHVTQVDGLCRTLYTSADQKIRASADGSLKSIFACPESRARDVELLASGSRELTSHEVAAYPRWLPVLTAGLDASSDPYTHVFMASSLAQCVSSFWVVLAPETRWDLRTALLNWLASRAAPGRTEPFVRTIVIGATAKITRLAWNSDLRHRATLGQCLQFIAPPPPPSPAAPPGPPASPLALPPGWSDLALLGCELLERLVSELGQGGGGSGGRPGVACSFLEAGLRPLIPAILALQTDCLARVAAVTRGLLALASGGDAGGAAAASALLPSPASVGNHDPAAAAAAAVGAAMPLLRVGCRSLQLYACALSSISSGGSRGGASAAEAAAAGAPDAGVPAGHDAIDDEGDEYAVAVPVGWTDAGAPFGGVSAAAVPAGWLAAATSLAELLDAAALAAVGWTPAAVAAAAAATTVAAADMPTPVAQQQRQPSTAAAGASPAAAGAAAGGPAAFAAAAAVGAVLQQQAGLASLVERVGTAAAQVVGLVSGIAFPADVLELRRHGCRGGATLRHLRLLRCRFANVSMSAAVALGLFLRGREAKAAAPRVAAAPQAAGAGAPPPPLRRPRLLDLHEWRHELARILLRTALHTPPAALHGAPELHAWAAVAADAAYTALEESIALRETRGGGAGRHATVLLLQGWAALLDASVATPRRRGHTGRRHRRHSSSSAAAAAARRLLCTSAEPLLELLVDWVAPLQVVPAKSWRRSSSRPQAPASEGRSSDGSARVVDDAESPAWPGAAGAAAASSASMHRMGSGGGGGRPLHASSSLTSSVVTSHGGASAGSTASSDSGSSGGSSDDDVGDEDAEVLGDGATDEEFFTTSSNGGDAAEAGVAQQQQQQQPFDVDDPADDERLALAASLSRHCPEAASAIVVERIRDLTGTMRELYADPLGCGSTELTRRVLGRCQRRAGRLVVIAGLYLSSTMASREDDSESRSHRNRRRHRRHRSRRQKTRSAPAPSSRARRMGDDDADDDGMGGGGTDVLYRALESDGEGSGRGAGSSGSKSGSSSGYSYSSESESDRRHGSASSSGSEGGEGGGSGDAFRYGDAAGQVDLSLPGRSAPTRPNAGDAWRRQRSSAQQQRQQHSPATFEDDEEEGGVVGGGGDSDGSGGLSAASTPDAALAAAAAAPAPVASAGGRAARGGGGGVSPGSTSAAAGRVCHPSASAEPPPPPELLPHAAALHGFGSGVGALSFGNGGGDTGPVQPPPVATPPVRAQPPSLLPR